MHISLVFGLKSFDKCLPHLCNEHLNKGIDHFHHPKMFSQPLFLSIPESFSVPLQSIPSFPKIHIRGNHYSDFYHHRLLFLLVLVLELFHFGLFILFHLSTYLFFF